MRAVLAKAIKAIAAEVGLREIFVFTGIGCAVYGAALVYPPAGWITAGVALFYLGHGKP